MNKVYKWYRNGRLVKETLDPKGLKPFIEHTSNNSYIVYKYFYIPLSDTTILYVKEYYKNGVLHRDDGPAVEEYTEDGEVYSEGYYRNGIRLTI